MSEMVDVAAGCGVFLASAALVWWSGYMAGRLRAEHEKERHGV